MSYDATDPAQIPYVRVSRVTAAGDAYEVLISRAAMHLHTFGVLTGLETATPGFVSDDYLSSIRAETTMAALELTVAGLWERTDGGYRIATRDLVGIADQVVDRLASIAARCEAEGGHRTPSGGTCSRCGTQVTAMTAMSPARRRTP